MNAAHPEPVTRASRRGMLAGLVIVFGVPLLYWLLAMLIDAGIASYDAVRPHLDELGLVSLSEVVLGPLGIVVAGRSAHVHGVAWILLFLVALPSALVVWFIGVASLSGALGNPF